MCIRDRPKRDGELSRFMQWVTVTHVRRWHAHRKSTGAGPLYQGRFRSFPAQDDQHLLVLIRYVERNALRAKLCRRAEQWRWSSLACRQQGMSEEWLTAMSDWPVKPARGWVAFVNTPQTTAELESLRQSLRRGRPFGDEGWVKRTAAKLNLTSSLNDPWRPRKKS